MTMCVCANAPAAAAVDVQFRFKLTLLSFPLFVRHFDNSSPNVCHKKWAFWILCQVYALLVCWLLLCFVWFCFVVFASCVHCFPSICFIFIWIFRSLLGKKKRCAAFINNLYLGHTSVPWIWTHTTLGHRHQRILYIYFSFHAISAIL